MKKVLRKLIPSIIMMLIAAAFVGTSTFAWFSMNRTVTVTGMSVNTQVDDNLKIAASNAEANYRTGLEQTRTGSLRPVSSVDGVAFFYTGAANVNEGTGAVLSETYTAYSEAETVDGQSQPTNALANNNAGKTHYDADFQTAYGTSGNITTSNVAYGYIDYVFYLKAMNVSGADEYLKLTTLELTYDDGNVAETSWRVAVFAQAASANTNVNTAPTAGDLITILTLAGATNQTDGEAVDSTSSTDDVTYGTAANIAEIEAGDTDYYKVTIRLWLEGEDTDCTNATFKDLTEDYELNIAFHIGGSEAAVTAISTPAAQQQQNP